MELINQYWYLLLLFFGVACGMAFVIGAGRVD